MKLRFEHVLCAVGGSLLLLGLWRWQQLPAYAPASTASYSEAPFQAAEITRSNDLAAVWVEPQAQSAGREWIFEIFTPPVIYFDQVTQRFTVLPPLAPAQEKHFGVELYAISDKPYRLKYAGHHGVEGDYVVEIRDVESGRFYRGRPGTTFDQGSFALRDFRSERVIVQPQKSNRTPYIERTIRLVVEDFLINETIELGRDALILPDPVVILEDEQGRRSAELRAGDQWLVGSNRFQITSVDRTSGSVTIQRLAFDGSIESEKRLSLEKPAAESEL